jgi:hypothetical protein
MACALTFALALALTAGGTARADAAAADPILAATLDRVTAKVLEYYERAQSIVATETVRMQPLGAGLALAGPARRLVYELRMEWSAPDAPGTIRDPNVIRRLLTVNGDAPRSSEQPACEDPRSVSPEPLFMLLPEHRREFGFSLGRPQRVNDRMATTVDYISLPVGSSQPTWTKDCVSIPLEGRTRGRIWIDADTDVVVKLEEHLVGMVEVRVPFEQARGTSQSWMSLERADYEVRYAPVHFTDPDETVHLPASVESLRIFRGSGYSRMRVTQTYSGYRRFLTNSRLIAPVLPEKQ